MWENVVRIKSIMQTILEYDLVGLWSPPSLSGSRVCLTLPNGNLWSSGPSFLSSSNSWQHQFNLSVFSFLFDRSGMNTMRSLSIASFFSILVLKFIHVVACVRASLVFKAETLSFACTYHTWFSHQSFYGCLCLKNKTQILKSNYVVAGCYKVVIGPSGKSQVFGITV